MTPTQLHPTDLIAVPVQGDAIKIRKAKTFVGYSLKDGTERFDNIRIDDFEILGTCTKSDIDFDVSEHLPKDEDMMYKNYDQLPIDWFIGFSDANTSFRSLLTANGLHFENNDNRVEKLVILKRV